MLGYLDGLILLPLGIWLSIKLMPPEVLREYREKAKERLLERKPNYAMAVAVVLVWLLLGYWAYRLLTTRL